MVGNARDAQLLGLGPEGPIQSFLHVDPVPLGDELLSTLHIVNPMQLLSYFIAAQRGLAVDQLLNLAKSVTAELPPDVFLIYLSLLV